MSLSNDGVEFPAGGDPLIMVIVKRRHLMALMLISELLLITEENVGSRVFQIDQQRHASRYLARRLDVFQQTVCEQIDIAIHHLHLLEVSTLDMRAEKVCRYDVLGSYLGVRQLIELRALDDQRRISEVIHLAGMIEMCAGRQ
jgi:hypothetical protein